MSRTLPILLAAGFVTLLATGCSGFTREDKAPVLTTNSEGEITAQAPAGCPGWSQRSIMTPTNILDPYSNQPYPDFGCATASNLAKMVADPATLQNGVDLGEADGTVNSAAVTRYHEDKVKVIKHDDEMFLDNN